MGKHRRRPTVNMVELLVREALTRAGIEFVSDSCPFGNDLKVIHRPGLFTKVSYRPLAAGTRGFTARTFEGDPARLAIMRRTSTLGDLVEHLKCFDLSTSQ